LFFEGEDFLLMPEKGCTMTVKMDYDSGIRNRRSIRLPKYDYSQPGAYFVTINAYEKSPIFGEISNDVMKLNKNGLAAKRNLEQIKSHFHFVNIDAFIVMPDHVHAIIVLLDENPSDVGAQHAAPLQGKAIQPLSGSLAAIVRSYKSSVTRDINLLRKTPAAHVWQCSYYEHVIRSEEDLNETRE
jgi:putative transposase